MCTACTCVLTCMTKMLLHLTMRELERYAGVSRMYVCVYVHDLNVATSDDLTIRFAAVRVIFLMPSVSMWPSPGRGWG